MSVTALSSTASGLPSLQGPSANLVTADKGFFGTLLDIVNPLQHIPVVSDIYQSVTGDVPSAAASVIGGGLFGGVIGAVASLAGEALRAATGDDIAGNLEKGVTSLTTNSPDGVTVESLTAHTPKGLYATGSVVDVAQASQSFSIADYEDGSLGLKDKKLGAQYQANMEKAALAL